MNGSLEVITQDFSGAEVCALTGPPQEEDFVSPPHHIGYFDKPITSGGSPGSEAAKQPQIMMLCSLYL